MESQDTLRQCPDCGGNLMQVTSCKWISTLNGIDYEDVKHTYYCGKCGADKSTPPASEESHHLQFMNSGVTEKLRITSKGDVFLEGEYVGSLVSDTPASEEG